MQVAVTRPGEAEDKQPQKAAPLSPHTVPQQKSSWREGRWPQLNSCTILFLSSGKRNKGNQRKQGLV